MPVTEGKALTSTPDLAAGNPVDVVVVATSQGNVDRQVLIQGDPSDPNARAAVKNGAVDGTEYGGVVRTIPSSTLVQLVDVSDRDARLAGRHKVLDSLGSVVDPALKSQLPAALVGGRLDVNLGAAPVTIPADVSDRDARLAGRIKLLDSLGNVIDPSTKGQLPATLGQKVMASSFAVVIASDQTALDVSDRAARDLGKGRVWDGTNIAAVKAASTPAALADPALVVALSPNSYQNRLTYRAVYRLAARPYALSKVFTANTRVQFATLHHTGAATKKVRVRRVLVLVESSSVAAITMWDLAFITAAPATGNPVITPTPLNRGDAASEAVALALPTTAGTEGALITTSETNLGVTGAASTVNPPPFLAPYELYSEDETSVVGDVKSIELRAGTLEGIAVIGDCNAAATVKGYVIITFTEE